MPECYLSQNHVYFFFFLLNFLNAINTQRNGQVWNYIMLYNKNFNLLVLILFEFFFFLRQLFIIHNKVTTNYFLSLSLR